MSLDLSIYDATLIPAIMFVLYIIGNVGVPRRFLPVVALILGIVAGLFIIELSVHGAIAGVLLAASVVGFHSGTKNVFKALSNTSKLEDLIGEEIVIPHLSGKYIVNSISASGAIQVKKVTSSGL